MRDPLTDPRPGDIVQGIWNGKEVKRTVVFRTGDRVRYTKGLVGTQRVWVATWQSWCRKTKAVVLTRGEE